MDKNEVRKQIILKRKSLNREVLQENSVAVFNQLFSTINLDKFSVVMVYKSFGGEILTDAIIERLKKSNKIVVHPLTINDEMVAVLPKSNHFEKDRFGIDVPCDYEIVEKVDLAITPLVACDLNRNRMGFGKGFYDKFFSQHNCYKVGICHDFQIIDTVFPQNWDVPLDCIISEKRTF